MAEIFLSQLPQLARAALARILAAPGTGARIMFLQGELGSGKTTFMQQFARELDIDDIVQSPTYVLMKSYPIDVGGFTTLIHIDAYRLEGANEFKPLKPEEFLHDPHAIVCIEWPEKIEGALPKPDLVLQFSHREGDANARDIEMLN